MWIYAKDDEANLWKIEYEVVEKAMVAALTTDSPVKAVSVEEDDVLDWALDNAHTFTSWTLVERASAHQPINLVFAMVIVNENIPNP